MTHFLRAGLERSAKRGKRLSVFLIVAVSICYQSVCLAAESNVSLNVGDYDRSCGIEIAQQDSQVLVTWPLNSDRRARLTMDLTVDRPLIDSIAISRSPGRPFELIAESLDPVVLLRVGKRDLQKRGGWTIFFDRMQEKPNELFNARIDKTSAVASSKASRAALDILCW